MPQAAWEPWTPERTARIASIVSLTTAFALACNTGEKAGDDAGNGGEDTDSASDTESETVSDAGADTDTGADPDGPDYGAVFDGSFIHTVDIQVDDDVLAGWAPADGVDASGHSTPEDEYVSCDVTIDGVPITNAGIHRKGGITFRTAVTAASPFAGRYAFVLKLDAFVKGQSFKGLDKITLNSGMFDKARLNEELGYGMYRAMGIPAALTTHAVVTVNGEIYGLYVMKEPINKQFLRRNFGEENDEGNLYEGSGDVGPFDEMMEVPFPTLKDADEEGRTTDDIKALSDFLVGLSDEVFAAEAPEKIDLDGFITGAAIDALTVHFDGYMVTNNFYLYHNPVDDRFVFLPHGMDMLFSISDWEPEPPDTDGPMDSDGHNGNGNEWDQYLALVLDPENDPFIASEALSAYLWRRMAAVDALEAQFEDEVARVFETTWDVDALHSRVQQLSTNVEQLETDDAAFQQELDGILEQLDLFDAFIDDRAQFLSSLLGE